MRQLILMRHGKAESTSGQGDHARPLSRRGRAEAAEAGRRLAAIARPELALMSDSLRTRQTFDSCATTLDPTPPRRIASALYGATPDAILREIGTVADAVSCLLVIGHNPGIGDLARRLADRGPTDELARLSEGFPTSCFAVISLDAPRWSEAARPGRLTFLLPADQRSAG